MSVPQIYVICLLSLAGAAVCAWQVRRALRDNQQPDIGPDALRLLEELDAHLDNYVLADPELAAGFDRLRTAITDHRKEEDR